MSHRFRILRESGVSEKAHLNSQQGTWWLHLMVFRCPGCFKLIIIFFLSLWDLGSPTRDWTPAFKKESLELYPLDHQGILSSCWFSKILLSVLLKNQISELSKLSRSDLGEARWGVMVTQKCMHHAAWFSSMHYFLFKQRTLSCSCSSESCFVFVPRSTHTHTYIHHTHTHTHTHTHRVIFSLKKRKSHSCTPAFEEWCLGKTTRETACSLCLCTMHACVLSCSVVSNSTTEKIFFFKKRAIQGTFLMSPVIKRLHLPMKGCRINPWSGNPTCLEAKNPKHKKKKEQFTYKRA